jgi:hypothetical protein
VTTFDSIANNLTTFVSTPPYINFLIHSSQIDAIHSVYCIPRQIISRDFISQHPTISMFLPTSMPPPRQGGLDDLKNKGHLTHPSPPIFCTAFPFLSPKSLYARDNVSFVLEQVYPEMGISPCRLNHGESGLPTT